jgi:hypothetical protein
VHGRGRREAVCLGEAMIDVAQRGGRCVMTPYDPDTQEPALTVLQRLGEECDGRMGRDCAVIESVPPPWARQWRDWRRGVHTPGDDFPTS